MRVTVRLLCVLLAENRVTDSGCSRHRPTCSHPGQTVAMPSHSRPGWRRLTKTRGKFEAIPSLRVPGKDTVSAMSRKAPRKAALDPTLFPGRRLERRQQSTYSMVSGTSGQSGVDQITLPGSCRAGGPGSTAGSITKQSHISLPAVGASHNRTPPTVTRRHQAGVGEDEEEGKISSAPVLLPHSSILPPQSSFVKVSRWQLTKFTLNAARHRPGALKTQRDVLVETSDSDVSDDSGLRPPLHKSLPHPPDGPAVRDKPLPHHAEGPPVCYKPLPHQADWRRPEQVEKKDPGLPLQKPLLHHPDRRRPEQVRKEPGLHGHGWGRHVAPPPPSPPPKVASTFPSQQQQQQQQQQQHQGVRHVHPHRRPANTPAVSPPPPPPPPPPSADSGPRLNKILWALAPDEHVNASEGRASRKPSSCHGASLQGTLNKTVTVTDLEVDSDLECSVPKTPRNPQLTEHLLQNHNQAGPWEREDRIQTWLAQCDQETTSQSLISYLPDIQYTFRFLQLHS
ncbi:hypothetical protein ACOMHN_028518 [Nucella lapillus]